MPERNRAGLSINILSCASGVLNSACVGGKFRSSSTLCNSPLNNGCVVHMCWNKKAKASDNSRPNAPDIQGPRQALIAAINVATTPVYVGVGSAGHGYALIVSTFRICIGKVCLWPQTTHAQTPLTSKGPGKH